MDKRYAEFSKTEEGQRTGTVTVCKYAVLERDYFDNGKRTVFNQQSDSGLNLPDKRVTK